MSGGFTTDADKMNIIPPTTGHYRVSAMFTFESPHDERIITVQLRSSAGSLIACQTHAHSHYNNADNGWMKSSCTISGVVLLTGSTTYYFEGKSQDDGTSKAVSDDWGAKFIVEAFP